MVHGDFGSALPLAATMDMQYRLPPFQQIFFTPTIFLSVAMLGIVLIVVLYLSRRSRVRAREEQRREALKMAEKILITRGGSTEDVDRVLSIFTQYPKIDPSAVIMIRERFQNQLSPILAQTFDKFFAERMEKLYFPPPNDTRRAIAGQSKAFKSHGEEKKGSPVIQTPANILDLMDATLSLGVVTRLVFEGIEGGHECMIMGHDMQTINVTLPAYNDRLVASLKPGMKIDGSLESGPSLLAFTSSVMQAVAGSMPYCKISAWKSVCEIRKRDSVRLPIALDIDFQHISTAQTESIKMSNLDREIGSVRPGHLMDLSLGGCCIETPSDGVFRVGDMIRFSKALVNGIPPATLLGSIVEVDKVDPETNNGAVQRLHIQFLIVDDVSQRILVRTLRQLQEVAKKEEWIKAQQLLQQMRKNQVENIGSPSPAKQESTGSSMTGSARDTGIRGTAPRIGAHRPPSTRSLPRISNYRPGTRPPTRHKGTR